LVDVPHQGIFKVMTYLVMSARDCIDEPSIYGPLRLLVGVDKLIDICKAEPSFDDEFLVKMKSRIWQEVFSVMSDRDAFAKALDQLSVEFTDELKRRMATAENTAKENK